MSITHRWLAALLAVSALSACASAPPARYAASPQRSTYVTGSRVAVPVDPHTGLPQTASPLQIVSADDLRRTGQLDVASALRMLLPEFQ